MMFKMDIPKNAHEILVEDIKSFAKYSGLSPRAVGRRAMGDNQLMERLEAGKSLKLSSVEDLYDFMRNFKQKG